MSSMFKSGNGIGQANQLATVFSLAQAHLRYEWVLTLCLVSALTAVIAPLLILMGLKVGVITTLRNELVEDPSFREIRPAITRQYSDDWLEKRYQDPRVAYMVPSILPASSIIYVSSTEVSNGGGDKQLLDLNPTSEGDVLLLENKTPIPKEGECVLTASAATKLSVSAGDSVFTQITRRMNGKQQDVNEKMKVVGVLPDKANSVSAIYTTLSFVKDVEAYKEGRHVSKRNWEGQIPYPPMTFDGVFVLSPQALDQILLNGLVINTGFHTVKHMTNDDFYHYSGMPLPGGWYVYQLHVMSGSVTISSIKAISGKLRGNKTIVIPYADDIKITNNDKEMKIFGISISEGDSKRLGWPILPWGRMSLGEVNMDRILQILLPSEYSGLSNNYFTLSGSVLKDFPLKIDGIENNIAIALVPAELMGMFSTAKTREVKYDERMNMLILEKAGYRGFRLYTKSIDNVPEMVSEFWTNDGLEVIAQVGAIERIQVLDKNLSKLFLFIAVMGVFGAGAVLIASLYAAVEREVKNLGILRLLGLSRTYVSWFPILQGLIISALSMVVSVLSYIVFSSIINYSFAGQMNSNDAICKLPSRYFIVAGGVVLLLTIISSSVAAWKVTKIEVAEAIREE